MIDEDDEYQGESFLDIIVWICILYLLYFKFVPWAFGITVDAIRYLQVLWTILEQG